MARAVSCGKDRARHPAPRAGTLAPHLPTAGPGSASPLARAGAGEGGQRAPEPLYLGILRERNVLGPYRRVSCLEELWLGWPTLAPGGLGVGVGVGGRRRAAPRELRAGAQVLASRTCLRGPVVWQQPRRASVSRAPARRASLAAAALSLLTCAPAAMRYLQSCLHKFIGMLRRLVP